MEREYRIKMQEVIFWCDVAGSFFHRFPRHDKLISINKCHTGQSNKEFNLRHDWNSILSDDDSLLFRHYSHKYFPHRQTIVRYLADYAVKLKLRVRYNTTVTNIKQNSSLEVGRNILTDQNGQQYTCKYESF